MTNAQCVLSTIFFTATYLSSELGREGVTDRFFDFEHP